MLHNDKMILEIIREFSAAKGISVTYAARILTGSGDTVARFDRGLSMTARRAERVMQKASDHWPEGAKWPSDIPRPAPKPAQDRAA